MKQSNKRAKISDLLRDVKNPHWLQINGRLLGKKPLDGKFQFSMALYWLFICSIVGLQCSVSLKKISKCQRLTYQKNFKATWHFLNQEKQIDFFWDLKWSQWTKHKAPPKMQSSLVTASCTKGALRNWCETSSLYNSLCIIEGF